MIKKSISCTLLAFVISFFTCACGVGMSNEKIYTNDLSASALAAELEKHLSGRELFEDVSERYARSKISSALSGDSAPEYVAKIALSQVCDEYGVFKTPNDEVAKKLCEEINASLERRRDEWDGRYYSEETPKINAAKAKRFGVYVIYGVLSPDELDGMFDRANKLIHYNPE